jgi:hypothetical protein
VCHHRGDPLPVPLPLHLMLPLADLQ